MRRTSQTRARRAALAQNFLIDPRVVDALLGTVALDPARDTVLDLGAGRGALTAALAPRAARVVAVERDPAWARELRAAGWPGVEVVEGDALRVPLPDEPFTVVASLPFNAGTALVRRLLAEGHGLVEAALILQLQAARRLAGGTQPASRAGTGGRFGATWAPWFELRVIRRVPAAAFRPVPRVDAGVLRVRARRPPLLSPAAFAAHGQLVDAVFAARGRTVGERLGRAIGRRPAGRALAAAGLHPRTGIGDVAPEAWARLTRALDDFPARRPSYG